MGGTDYRRFFFIKFSDTILHSQSYLVNSGMTVSPKYCIVSVRKTKQPYRAKEAVLVRYNKKRNVVKYEAPESRQPG